MSEPAKVFEDRSFRWEAFGFGLSPESGAGQSAIIRQYMAADRVDFAAITSPVELRSDNFEEHILVRNAARAIMTEAEHRIRTALALIKSMPVRACSEIAILLRTTSDPRLRWYLQPAAKGGKMTRPRAADDFAAIRARMKELRREREGTKPSEKEAQRDSQTYRARDVRWTASETSAGPGRVRQSG